MCLSNPVDQEELPKENSTGNVTVNEMFIVLYVVIAMLLLNNYINFCIGCKNTECKNITY